ncbi:MAG: sensor histidine kinase, partial [Planctomycetia bacterium]
SNCFKHAFADAECGRVEVTLHRDSDTNILTVSDDGCGFPPGADLTIADSFGLQLVTTLVEQLDGEAQLKTGRGTTVSVRFPKNTTGPV